MKTYKIDPLNKQRPLMLVRGTRIPEVFPDYVAECMANHLDTGRRGLIVGINGDVKLTGKNSETVVSTRNDGDNTNTVVMITECNRSQYVTFDDNNGQQCKIMCDRYLDGPVHRGNDIYYTGPYKDIRNFVRDVITYTGQPLLAESCRQWYSLTNTDGDVFTFRGCIQAKISDTEYAGLSVDKIEFGNTIGIPEDLQITLDSTRSVLLGGVNGMKGSCPYDFYPGIGWLQIVVTDNVKPHLRRLNENAVNADAAIGVEDNYNGFTYNIELFGIFTDPNDFRLTGHGSSCRIKVKEGSELCNSTVGDVLGYVSEYSGGSRFYPVSSSTYEDISLNLNGDTVTKDVNAGSMPSMVVRLQNVQSGEELHVDFSGTVKSYDNRPITVITMTARKVGEFSLSSTNNVISIPEGDMFAFFRVDGDSEGGTITVSRVSKANTLTTLREKIISDVSKTIGANKLADNFEIKQLTSEDLSISGGYTNGSGQYTRVGVIPAGLDIGGFRCNNSGYYFSIVKNEDGTYSDTPVPVYTLDINSKAKGGIFPSDSAFESYFIPTYSILICDITPLPKEEVQQKQELINKAREPHASADELLTDVLLANNKDYVTVAFTNKVEGYTLTNAGDYTFVKGSDVADMTVVGLVMFEVVTLNNGQYTHNLLQERVGNDTVSNIIRSVSQIPTDEWWIFIGNNNADSACSLIQAT